MNRRAGTIVSSEFPLYLSPQRPCGYLPGNSERVIFADTEAARDPQLYSALLARGFRRAGKHLYRPRCPSCEACVAVRLPVTDFAPRRRQRRVWKRNCDLLVRVRDIAYDAGHFELYQRYLASRHPDSGMDGGTAADYREFLLAPGVDGRCYEFWLAQRLVAVAMVDVLEDSLSAVYTCFDPELPERGLGVYAILWEIEAARKMGLSWLYLGYWIGDCRKMRYKAEFLPQERYLAERWQLFERFAKDTSIRHNSAPSEPP